MNTEELEALESSWAEARILIGNWTIGDMLRKASTFSDINVKKRKWLAKRAKRLNVLNIKVVD